MKQIFPFLQLASRSLAQAKVSKEKLRLRHRVPASFNPSPFNELMFEPDTGVEMMRYQLTNPGLCVIVFYAEWSEHCAVFRGVVSEVIEEYPEVPFFSVNVEKLRLFTEAHEVNKMPSALVYYDGSLLKTFYGENCAYQLPEVLDQYI